MSILRTYIFPIFTAGIIAFTAPVSAAVIDQNYITTDDPNHNTGVGLAAESLAQTFEVGLTGTLAGIEFNVLKLNGTSGDLTVDIRSLVGSGPDSLAINALGTTTVANSDIDTFGSSPYSWSSIYVDFSAENIAVTEGDMLAFVLSSPSGQGFGIQTDYHYDTGYAGGSRWSQTTAGMAFSESTYADLAFSTYVEVAQVPEPSIIALFAAGIFGIGFARRRQS